MSDFHGKTAISGIGATEFSKASGRSELQLALEAVLDALEDAGLEPRDVDGFVSYAMDSTPSIDVARCLGIPELTYFGMIDYGGGAACGTILHAAMAVASGAASTVVCYRAFNERSGQRFGAGFVPGSTANAHAEHLSWYAPHGLMTPAGWVAMTARRYMHMSGATSLDFGRVSVAARRHAAKNPRAWFYEDPITLQDHQDSRMIVDPLHLLDCCQESDGGVAIVVTSLERARDLKKPPAVIAAAAQGSATGQNRMTSYYRDEVSGLPEMGLVGRQLWRQSGLRPSDIQTAVLYDHFTPFVLMQLEEFGFCDHGEAKEFVADGAIEIGGGLPLNTHGGQLGEAYIHGMNGISEGVRQVRGSSTNQVKNVDNVLVSAGTGVPTSALIVHRDC